MKLARGKKGFTFLELAIVIAIMGILFIVAFPNYRVARDSGRLYSQGKQFEIDIKHMMQMSRTQEKDVKIELNTNVFSIGEAYRIKFVDEDRRNIKSVNLLPGVQIQATPSSFRFNKDGELRCENGFIATTPAIIAFSITNDEIAYEILTFGAIEQIR